MKQQYSLAAWIAAAIFSISLNPWVAAAQGQAGEPKPLRPPSAPPVRVKPKVAPVPRTPDGQPNITGVWLAQGMGTEAGVGSPFDRQTSAALVADRVKQAVEAGGKIEQGRCLNVIWDAKPDIDIPRGVIDPPDGQIPLTAWGLERKAEIREFQKLTEHPPADKLFQNIGPDETCMPGLPYPLFNVLPYSANQFFQGPGYVMMVQEFSHIYRYIPLDGRPHLSPNIRQWMGDSRGRWEGNTLVVDTTNFNGMGRFDGNPGAGVVMSEQAHLVERFTVVNPDTVLYEMTIDDPKTSPKPWKMAGAFNRAEKDYQLYEFACYEGNKSLWLEFGIKPPDVGFK